MSLETTVVLEMLLLQCRCYVKEIWSTMQVCLLDYEKAFDWTDWVKLLEILSNIGSRQNRLKAYLESVHGTVSLREG